MSELTQAPNHLQEWILFYLRERERLGLATKGADLFWPSDVEPLLEMGFVSVEQSHEMPSRQRVISGSTLVSLTEKRRNYFQR